jgi:hypothetical protein
MENLHTILQTIQSRDSRALNQDDINKMLLEVVDKAMDDNSNAKGLEVALKAIGKLGESIEDTSLNAMDEALKSKLPPEVLRVVERRK